MQVFPITLDLREQLKLPLGQLIPDGNLSMEVLKPYFELDGFVVCVGDKTTERIHDLGFSPALEIVDNFERRIAKERVRYLGRIENLVRTENRPGSISLDALRKLSKCLDLVNENKGSTFRLEVIGEEDLLALPVIAFFPKGTVTLYGQPGEGLVVVSSDMSKQMARKYLAEIGIFSLSQ